MFWITLYEPIRAKIYYIIQERKLKKIKGFRKIMFINLVIDQRKGGKRQTV